MVELRSNTAASQQGAAGCFQCKSKLIFALLLYSEFQGANQEVSILKGRVVLLCVCVCLSFTEL